MKQDSHAGQKGEAMDKDKVLPLVELPSDGNRSLLIAGSRILEAQRDADWERVKPLLKEVARTLELFPDLIDLGEALAQLGMEEEKP